MADSPLESTSPRKRGRKKKTDLLSPDIIFAIRYTYLTDPHSTMATLAKQFSYGTHIIAQLLSGPEYEGIREQIQRVSTEVVRDRLRAASELAADSWIRTFPAALAKGDHRPMKDLLTANKVIDPTGHTATTPVVIQIGVQSGSVTVTPVPAKPVQGTSTHTHTHALPDVQASPPQFTPPQIPLSADSGAPLPVQVQGLGTSGTGTEGE